MKSCPTCQGSYPNNFAVCPQDGTPLVDMSAWVEGGVIRGKYRILGKIGQGGMGAVYKALHLAFDELRALKVMAPELLSDQLFVKRFKHEAVITRKLQHANAVRVDDIDEAEDGRPFIVMEFIEGRSLKKLIQDEGPLPVPRVCSIVKQVAAALDAAHRLGMVHRDIKPENIVLVEAPEGERAKVLDFGIAKVKEARLGKTSGMTLTGTGVVIGTPQYMSPEQAMGKRGDELDGRSDLYSLGIVMYQMLTADLPFKADTTMEMLLAHMQKPPTPIRTLHPELKVPGSIANLTMRLLEKDRERRPKSGGALIGEIERVEKELGILRPTRALPPTMVVLPEQIPPAQAPVQVHPAGKESPVVDGAGLPPVPPAQPRAAAPAISPLAPAARPVIKAPVRESHWGLWVAALILLVGLGGGGWYVIAHRSAPVTEAPANSTPAPPQEAPGSGEQAQPSPMPASQGSAASETARPASPLQSESGGEKTSGLSTRVTPITSSTAARIGSKAPGTGVSMTAAGDTSRERPVVDPKKVRAALTLGDFYRRNGKYDEAIRAYQDGLTADPSNDDLRTRIDQVKKAKATEKALGLQ